MDPFSEIEDSKATQLHEDLVRTREITKRKDSVVRGSKHLFSATRKQLHNSVISLGNIMSEFNKNERAMQTKLMELHNDCIKTKILYGKRLDYFKNSVLAAFDAYLQVFISQVFSPILALSGQVTQNNLVRLYDDSDFNRKILNDLDVLNSSLTLALDGARVQMFNQFSETEKKGDVMLGRTIHFISRWYGLRGHFNSALPKLRRSLDNLILSISNQDKDASVSMDALVRATQSVHTEMSDLRVGLFKTIQKRFEDTLESLSLACDTELRRLHDTGYEQFRDPLNQLIQAARSFDRHLEEKSSEFFNGNLSFSDFASQGEFEAERKRIDNIGIYLETGVRDTVAAMRATSMFIKRLLVEMYDCVMLDTFTKEFAYVLGLQWMDTLRKSYAIGGSYQGYYEYNGTSVRLFLRSFPIYGGGFRDDKSARYWRDIIRHAAGDLTTGVKAEISKILNTTNAIVKYVDEYSAETQVNNNFYK